MRNYPEDNNDVLACRLHDVERLIEEDALYGKTASKGDLLIRKKSTRGRDRDTRNLVTKIKSITLKQARETTMFSEAPSPRAPLDISVLIACGYFHTHQ